MIFWFGFIKLTLPQAEMRALKNSPALLVQGAHVEEAKANQILAHQRLFSPAFSFQFQASPEQKGVFFLGGVPFNTSASLYTSQISWSKLLPSAWQVQWNTQESRFNQNIPVASINYFMQTSLSLSYPLLKIQRKKMFSPLELSDLQRKEEEIKSIQTRAQVLYNVRQAFLEALRWKETVRVQEQLLQEAEVMHKAVEEKIQTGKLPPSELLIAQTDVQQRKLQLSLAQDSYANSLSRLRFLLSLPVEEEIELLTEGLSIPEYEQKDLESSPTVMLLLLAREKLQIQLDSARAERSGDLLFALGVNFQGRGADHPEAGEDLRFTEWNVRVQYNYLPGLNPVQPLEKSIIAAEQALQEEIARLRAEWATAERNLHSAKERVVVAEKNVEVARNSFEATRARFRVGLASILDVLHSENLLLSAELSLLEARFEVLLSQAKLVFLLGKE